MGVIVCADTENTKIYTIIGSNVVLDINLCLTRIVLKNKPWKTSIIYANNTDIKGNGNSILYTYPYKNE